MSQGSALPGMAIVALTHGLPSAANRAAVIRLVDAVSNLLPRVEVSIRFVDASRPDPALLETLNAAADALVVIPFVLSAGFHLRARLAELLGDALHQGRIVIADPLAPDARIVEALVARLQQEQLAADDAVVIAAAGSSNSRALKECAETARLVGQRLGRPVTVGYVSAASPRLADAIDTQRAVHPRARIVLGSYLLAPGTFYDAVRQAGADAATAPLLLADEAPDAGLVQLVVDRYWAAAARLPQPAPEFERLLEQSFSREP